MEKIKIIVQKWGKTGMIGIFLIFAFMAGSLPGQASKVQVLGATIHIAPTPTLTPLPTAIPVTIINNIILPTAVPTNVPQVTPTPGQPTPTVQPTPAPTVLPTPTLQPTEAISPTPIVSPTPIPQAVTVTIDYAGEHTASTYTTPITIGQTAWQAVQSAVGVANLHDTDYGGSLGIFITGFNGVDASANQYYDFQVNGTSSTVGVSSYIVNNQDKLKFVLTSF